MLKTSLTSVKESWSTETLVTDQAERVHDCCVQQGRCKIKTCADLLHSADGAGPDCRNVCLRLKPSECCNNSNKILPFPNSKSGGDSSRHLQSV